MKKENGYELIPAIINKVNKYSEKLKDRVKIDNIFNEIDLYATDGFKKFIRMSDNRYKCIKSGISLNDLLERQKNEYKELSDNILENIFYMNNEIEKESKKLYKKIAVKESKDLVKLRKDIINKNKSLSLNELLTRKKYENKNAKTKSVIREENSEINRKLKHSLLSEEKDENKQDKKKYLSEIVEMDKKFINQNIENYKHFLRDIEKTKDNSKIIKIMSRNDNLGHKYSFKLNNLKLLSYKEEKKEDIKQKKIEEDSKIDIKKLMKYTKRGNKKWFQEELKQKSLKRLNSIKVNLRKNEESPKATNNYSSNNNGKFNILNKNILNNNSNKNIFNKTTFTNLGNTIKTVKNEAIFIKNIRENFDIKRKTVNKFFKSNSLPLLEVYETRKSIKKSNISLSPEQKRNERISLMFDLNREIKGLDDESDKKIKDIYDLFKNTYYSKIKSWSKEENEIKGIKNKEDEIYENNKKYINEINSIKRNPHLFVDLYSLRDGIVNERIKLFNRSLNGPVYSRNSMQEKINDFNNYIENKEKERIHNEELLRQKQLEEAIKLKEEDAEYQVLQKMRKNLNLDNKIKKDEENIDFNYRYTSIIKNKDSKNISEQAFKDYLESLEVVKQKDTNNKFD